MQTFEKYLEEAHVKVFPTIADDDLNDHFDQWISEMESWNMMEWAELYGKAQYLVGKEEVLQAEWKITK